MMCELILASTFLSASSDRRQVRANGRPAVRQRTIQALRSLDANLSLKELARRIRREEDPGVLASVVKAFGDALDVSLRLTFIHTETELMEKGGAREEVPEKRRRQFDTLFAATARNLFPSPLLVQLIRALVSVVNTLPAAAACDLATHVVHQTRSLAEEVALEVTTSSSPWASGKERALKVSSRADTQHVLLKRAALSRRSTPLIR